MNGAPSLSEADVRLEVDRLFRRKHRSRLIALYGRGEATNFELDGDTWEVVPTSCELDLRGRLPLPGDDARCGRVYLVDWAQDVLPLDVACRLAGGRIYHIARDVRLAVLFGARQVEPGLAGSALARCLLSGVGGLRKISGLQLTRAEAWQRYLEAAVRLPEEAWATTQAWFKWALQDTGGPAFKRACGADEALLAVRLELLGWLQASLGPAGVLGWRAWEAGLAEQLVGTLILLDAADHAGDAYTQGLLDGQIASWLPGLGPDVRATRAAHADGSLLAMVLDHGEGIDRRLLAGAEKLAAAAGAESVCAQSEWIPAGHAARELALARCLEQFVADPSPGALTAVTGALDYLQAHRLDNMIRSKDHAEARRMVARLAAWLLARRARPAIPPNGSSWQPATELARRYSEEGGYLEWARQSARGLRGTAAPLQAAVQNLGATVAGEAREDDRRFAEAYVAWLEAGKPSKEALPIEHVTKRIAVPFVRGGQQRRLLLVLMDGMSHCAAVQLLHRLCWQLRWSPIAWRAPDWSGLLPLPPVLAVAPTLTEVSRSALFAGAAHSRFGDEGTERDGDRWSQNPHIRELLGGDLPPIFFRREILAGHDLPDEVKTAITDGPQIVAVVVNGIDEQLKGSVQVAVDYSQTPILPLEALLCAAEGAERAVLLVADHGHVAGDTMRVDGGRLDSGRPGGARWRALAESEQPAAEEVALRQNCWVPQGWDGLALLWDPGVANRSPRHGEHGGLSLAETVAPAILIGPEWLDRVTGEDVELSCRPLPVPEWWEMRIPRSSPPVVTTAEASPAQQLSLLGTVPTADPAPPAAAVEPSLVQALRGSRAFAQHVEGISKPELERVLGWLGALVNAGGSVPSADFARLCAVRAHQVGGVVARMGILNADGFAVVEHDVPGRRVILHRSRLAQQFGLAQ